MMCAERILRMMIVTVAMGASTASAATYWLIVEGLERDAKQMTAKSDVVQQLRRAAIQQFGVAKKNVTVLSYAGSPTESTNGVATADTLNATIRSLAARIGEKDRFVFYYAGQANAIKTSLRLNLQGPDITAEQLAAALAAIRAKTSLVVLDCPCAGAAAKVLAKSGRIVVMGSRADQPYTPKFGAVFVAAMTAKESDANGDRRVSLVETLQETAKQIDQAYRKESRLKTENFVLEDSGDGVANQTPWLSEKDGTDGRVAAGFFWKE